MINFFIFIQDHEFTTTYFVCPWLMNEKCSNVNYIDYFKSLERQRQYEHLQRERTRRIKQQKLWFSMDNTQNDHSFQTNSDLYQNISNLIPDLPLIDEIQIFDSQILNQDSIQIIKIFNGNSNILPNGFYERLLICLHSQFNERLDFYNVTIGRTIDRNLIKLERFDKENQIHLTINSKLFECIQKILVQNLFSFYPMQNFRIET